MRERRKKRIGRLALPEDPLVAEIEAVVAELPTAIRTSTPFSERPEGGGLKPRKMHCDISAHLSDRNWRDRLTHPFFCPLDSILGPGKAFFLNSLKTIELFRRFGTRDPAATFSAATLI